MTKYGYCRQLHPQSLIDKEASNNLVLAVTVAYNESDRTIGRHHSIRDFSIYLGLLYSLILRKFESMAEFSGSGIERSEELKSNKLKAFKINTTKTKKL